MAQKEGKFIHLHMHMFIVEAHENYHLNGVLDPFSYQKFLQLLLNISL
jgi:hypothetical protein